VTETMVAVRSSLLRDLYVVYSGPNPQTNKPVIHAYVNPLVKWIWLGGLVVLLGTLLALVPSQVPGPNPPGAPVRSSSGAVAEMPADASVLEGTH